LPARHALQVLEQPKMSQRQRSIDASARRPQLWLAADRGARLSPPRERVAPVDKPELPLEIEFEGLTLEEQRAALAGFPGGRRFVLVADNSRA
jgi:hypothetical protein